MSGKIFIAKSEDAKKMEVFASALVLRFFVSILLTLIYALVIAVMWRIQIFNINKYAHLPQLLLLGSGIIFLNSFSEFYKETFVGFIDFKGVLIISSCEYGGYLILGLIGLLIKKNVYSIVFGFFLSLLLTSFVGFGIVLKKYRLQKSHFRKEHIVAESKKYFNMQNI